MKTLGGNRPLTQLVLAFALVSTAEWAYVTALSVHALREDGTIAVGFVGLRFFVGAVSSLIDTPSWLVRRGRNALAWISTARAIGLLASAVLVAAGAPLALLLVLLALDSAASGQYRPAQSRIVRFLARTPQELVASATGTSTVKTLSQALGGVAGGTLLAVTTPAVVFAGAAGLFIAAAVLNFRLKTARLVPDQELAPAKAGPMLARFAGTVTDAAQVTRRSHLGGILVLSGLRTFVRGMWLAVAVIASIRLLHAGSAGVGLLMLAAGVGSLIAAPLSSLLIRRARVGTPAVVALVACGLPLAVVAGVPVFNLAMAVVVAWGAGMALADITTTSIVYRLVDTPMAPRVTGIIESTKLALEGLGGFLAPVLVLLIGTRGALWVAAVPLPLVAVAGWKMLHRMDATAGERAQLLELVHRVHWLHSLDIPSLENLVGRLAPVFVPTAGTDVVRQGEEGSLFYIVVSGRADVLVNGYVVGAVSRGDSFGERALLRDVPRMATVRSLSPMRLLALSRENFLAAVALAGADDAPAAPAFSAPGGRPWTRARLVDCLSRVSLLSHVGTTDLGQLADGGVREEWPAGALIVKRGDQGDCFFLLLQGQAVVVANGQEAELWPGDSFGEIAALHGVLRQADVMAATPALTLSVHRDDFMRFVPDMLPPEVRG
ncbi:MAG TPA: cyclic nucleotide-binding domain-containing protein [Acidimicrobiales bacterium]|nr:cyclic nucleotide-binding domain-containing protein [Acidimicrobiales bacterium]